MTENTSENANDNSGDELQMPSGMERRGSRLDEDAKADDQRTRVDAILAERKRIADGERDDTLSVRDRGMAAFLATLDDDERAAFVDKLADVVDLPWADDLDDPGQSDVLRLLFRAGVASVDPEAVDQIEEARVEETRRSL